MGGGVLLGGGGHQRVSLFGPLFCSGGIDFVVEDPTKNMDFFGGLVQFASKLAASRAQMVAKRCQIVSSALLASRASQEAVQSFQDFQSALVQVSQGSRKSLGAATPCTSHHPLLSFSWSLNLPSCCCWVKVFFADMSP